MTNQNVGISLLFKQNKKAILKTLVILSDFENLVEYVKNTIGKEIAIFYNYKYLGINDIFKVSGKVTSGEILGRTTFYDFNNLKKAKSLINNEFSFNKDSLLNNFNCTLIFFCENKIEKFTITATTVIKSSIDKIIDEAFVLGSSKEFIDKIILNSIEEITKIIYIGIDDICDIDLKFDVFQTFYSDLNFIDLKKEILSKKEIKQMSDSFK